MLYSVYSGCKPSYLAKSICPEMVMTSFSTLMSRLSLLTPGISSTTVSACSVSKISVTGTKARVGTVLSCFFSTSCFCWGRISCCAMALLQSWQSSDLDGSRLLACRAGYEQSQDAIAILRPDSIRIDLHRQRYRTIEDAEHPLAPVHACPRVLT